MASAYYPLWALTSAAAVVSLLLEKREPLSTLSWLLFVTLVPFFGPLLYYLIGPQQLRRQAHRRKKEIETQLNRTSFIFPVVTESSLHADHELNVSESHVLNLAGEISDYPGTSGNHVEIFTESVAALSSIQEAIDKAKDFIHLEYYIIESDEVTKKLFEHLMDAAKRGVEVRILYDSLGSLFLKRIYFRKLVENGVKIAGFLPFTLLPRRINFHFRNHRKILMVDGHLAFTGGTNIGKHYFGKLTDSLWHDYTMRVEGPVCQQLEDVFAKDWHFTTQEDLFQAKYYPEPQYRGKSIVQVLESGPDTLFSALHQVFFYVMNSAMKQIALMTPYFVPDRAITMALTSAALRGVNVTLLLPQKNDSWLVQYASRSFYDELLRAGVRIFEYEPRILHAKILCIDGKWTIIGSANMDIRSFRYNFELNLLVYGKKVAEQAEALFSRDIHSARETLLETHLRRPLRQQLLENTCRLLSPVL